MNKDDFYKDKLDFIKKKFDEVYDFAFHKGRHSCRRKYVQSGYLIVDPNKVNQLIEDCEDPCRYCDNYEPSYKRGCTLERACEKKEKQFDAIEIKKYFLDNLPIYDD